MTNRSIPRQILEISLTLSDGRNVNGEIQIDLDTRLSDFINMPQQFIVLNTNDNNLLLINKNHIVEARIL